MILLFIWLPILAVLLTIVAFWRLFSQLTLLQQLGLVCLSLAVLFQPLVHFAPFLIPAWIAPNLLVIGMIFAPICMALLTIVVFWKRMKELSIFQRFSLIVLEISSVSFLGAILGLIWSLSQAMP